MLATLDKIQEQMQTMPLSAVLPLLYPIALECADYKGYCMLNYWGYPLGCDKKVNQVIRAELPLTLGRSGLDIQQINEVLHRSFEEWLILRTIAEEQVLCLSAKEMEDKIKNLNEIIQTTEERPSNMHPTDMYFYISNMAQTRLKSIESRQEVEKQYAVLVSFMTSKIMAYRQIIQEREKLNNKSERKRARILNFSKVFIVHGHDEALTQAVARLIEKQSIEAIILKEQRNGGDTIITKFEKNSNVGAAIFLFTADDLGKAKDEAELKKRARQNVVFEAGYFMGKLGRERTIMISDKDIEIPSDMQGIVYTDSTNWQLDVLRELEGIGYKIDYNKQFGMSR